MLQGIHKLSSLFPLVKGNFVISELHYDDLDEIANWPKYQKPFAWVNFDLKSHEMQKKWYDRLKRNNIFWFTIRFKEKIISRGSLILPEEEDEVILGIVLRPDMVNQGYGTKSVNFLAESLLNSNYYNSIWLETKSDNIRAQKVWEKIGFEYLGTHYRKDVYGVYAKYKGYRLSKLSKNE